MTNHVKPIYDHKCPKCGITSLGKNSDDTVHCYSTMYCDFKCKNLKELKTKQFKKGK